MTLRDPESQVGISDAKINSKFGSKFTGVPSAQRFETRIATNFDFDLVQVNPVKSYWRLVNPPEN